MRGILWKWLFTLGSIFWVALCVTDYYKQNIERHPEYLRSQYIEDDVGLMLPMKKEPPALTFWKTLSMVLSVSALVYIKRSSSCKKYTKTNLMLTYPNQDDLNNFSTSPRLFKNVSVFPSNKTYCPDQKNNQITLEPRRIVGTNTKNIPGIVGVELVQKKLENLERSVASLKQRHQGSTSGLISGSPEFQKFLSKQSIKTSCSDLSVTSSCTSTARGVTGSCLVTLTSSSEQKVVQQVPQMLSSSTSTTTINRSVIFNTNKENSTQKIVENIKDTVSVNLSGKTEDSSWSTISEEVSSNNNESSSELEVAPSLPVPNVPLSTIIEASSSPITEIYQIKQTFSLTSKTSGLTESTEAKSVHSIQSTVTDTVDMLDYEDDSQVPGSNLVSTSGNTSICSSSTLMSSSTNNMPMFYDESSCFSFEDDVLFNTLD